MVDMQNDVVDIMAREMTPHIVKIAKRSNHLKEFDPEQQSKINKMLSILKGFKGVMDKDSYDASIYAVFQYFFFRGFLYKYTTGSASPQNWHSA